MINLVTIRDFSSLWLWLARWFRETFSINYAEVIKNIKAFPKFNFERLSSKAPLPPQDAYSTLRPSVKRWGMAKWRWGAPALTAYPLSMLGKESTGLLLPREPNPQELAFFNSLHSCVPELEVQGWETATVVSDKEALFGL